MVDNLRVRPLHTITSHQSWTGMTGEQKYRELLEAVEGRDNTYSWISPCCAAEQPQVFLFCFFFPFSVTREEQVVYSHSNS